MKFIYRQHDINKADTANSPWFTGSISLCIIMLFLSVFISYANAADKSDEKINIGFSTSFFHEVSRNDAIAAIRAWTQALLNKQDITAVPMPIMFESIAEIRKVLSSEKLDYIAITTPEYYEVRDLLPNEVVTVSMISKSITEEYLLLVPRNTGKDNIEDLKGKKLLTVKSARLSLATVWLDTILLSKGLGSAEDFFGSIDSEKSAGKVILPVFFNQAHACLVTRNMYNTMVELNPQIGKTLKIIAVSPALIPTFFSFTQNSDRGLREKVLLEISRWHLSSFGKQSLTMFQADSIETHPISCLDSAINLIEEHKRLIEKSGQAKKNSSDSASHGKSNTAGI